MKSPSPKIVILAFSIVWFASIVQAAQINVTLDFKEFGHLPQGLEDSCLSTAMANSFRFLENHYPKTYDNKLTGKTDDDLKAARDKLRDGYTAPDGTKRTGTGCPSSGFSFKQIWEGKVFYVEDFAPRTTIFAGMQKLDTITRKDIDTTGWHMGDKITKANPTFDFLLQELRNEEDVEFGWMGGGFDHEMTLAGLHLDDKNDNGKLDAGETASIDYIDPENPSKTITGLNLAVDKDGFLTFTYDNGKGKTVAGVQIYSAYSESPKKGPGGAPAPATIGLFVFGSVFLIGWGRWRTVARRMCPSRDRMLDDR
jgi:hypothetical protein